MQGRSKTTLEYVDVVVTAALPDGVPIDATQLGARSVDMAFVVDTPVEQDWHAAAWADGPDGQLVATCLVGPADNTQGAAPRVTLVEGTWQVWARVHHDSGDPQIPVLLAGALVIEA